MTSARGIQDGSPLQIFLVAVEESGDTLGASLMNALRARLGETVQFSGVGGSAMAACGLTSQFSIADISIVGIAAIPARLPKILRHIRATAAAVVAAKPAALVIIDGPDFTHRVARRVRKAKPSIPIIDFVSPQVWAWRPRRAIAMRSYIDHVLALLPFEPAFYASTGGPPCTYVGHPLIENIALLRPSPAEASRRLTDPPLLVVLPGSRSAEVERHLSIFGEAIARVQSQRKDLDVVLPTFPRFVERIGRATAGWPVRPRIVVEPMEKLAAFRMARAALAKSGTVTLELALAGVPMVTAYKLSRFDQILVPAISVSSIILANLVLGENIVPEFVDRACTPHNLAQALLPLLADTAERRRQVEAFGRLDAIMEIGQANPSARAADIVLGLAMR